MEMSVQNARNGERNDHTVCVFFKFLFLSEGSILEHQETATAVNSAYYSAMFDENLKPAI